MSNTMMISDVNYLMGWCTTEMITKVDTAFCSQVDRPWMSNLLNKIVVHDEVGSKVKHLSFKWCLLRRVKFSSLKVCPQFLNAKHEFKVPIQTSAITSIHFCQGHFEQSKLQSTERREGIHQFLPPGTNAPPIVTAPVPYKKPDALNDDDIVAFSQSCKNVQRFVFENYHSFKDTTLSRIDPKVLGKLTHLKIEDKCVDFKEILRTIGEKVENLQHLTIIGDRVQETDLVECLKLLPHVKSLQLNFKQVNCLTLLPLIPTMDLYRTLESLIVKEFPQYATAENYQTVATFIQGNPQITHFDVGNVVKVERANDGIALEVLMLSGFQCQYTFSLLETIRNVTILTLHAPMSGMAVMAHIQAEEYIKKVVTEYSYCLVGFLYVDSTWSQKLKNGHLKYLLTNCPLLESIALVATDKLVNVDFHLLGEWGPNLKSLTLSANNSINTKTIIKLMNNKNSNIRDFTFLKCNIVDCSVVAARMKKLNSKMTSATARPFTLEHIDGCGYKQQHLGCNIM